ncbi:MAG: hypothetical protein KQI35_08360 [Bacteroidetes bacterium]|nr:hypothetical protein [Bacteroidota bacterium]
MVIRSYFAIFIDFLVNPGYQNIVNIYRQHTSFIVVILLAIIGLSGCKKEENNQIPTIIIQSPFPNQVFSTLDSIAVEAVIEDDKNITSVKVVLTDEKFIPVQQPVYFFPEAPQYDLILNYTIDQNIMEGGSYYLQVRAEDGKNFKNAYQPVNIVAAPRELERVLVLTEPVSGKIELFEIDISGIAEPISLFDGDFAAAAIDHAGRQLFIAGKNQLNLLAFNLADKIIEWELEQVPSLPMHSDNCLYFDDFLYATYYSDYVYGYNNNGSIVFNATTDESEAPGRIWCKDNHLLIDFQRKNGGQPYIKTLFALTGLEKQRTWTSFKVIDFFDYEDDDVIITANSGLNGCIYNYQINSNALTLLKEITAPILCSAQVDKNQLMVATPEGIFLYLIEAGIWTGIYNQENIKRISFDDINKNVYIIAGNSIQVLSWPQMVNQKTLPFSDTILDLHLQFTKKM